MPNDPADLDGKPLWWKLLIGGTFASIVAGAYLWQTMVFIPEQQRASQQILLDELRYERGRSEKDAARAQADRDGILNGLRALYMDCDKEWTWARSQSDDVQKRLKLIESKVQGP